MDAGATCVYYKLSHGCLKIDTIVGWPHVLNGVIRRYLGTSYCAAGMPHIIRTVSVQRETSHVKQNQPLTARVEPCPPMYLHTYVTYKVTLRYLACRVQRSTNPAKKFSFFFFPSAKHPLESAPSTPFRRDSTSQTHTAENSCQIHRPDPASSSIMSVTQKLAILSVYDKTGLLDLAKGLVKQNVRILASGGTSRMIRDAGMPVEYVQETESPDGWMCPPFVSPRTRGECKGKRTDEDGIEERKTGIRRAQRRQERQE